MNRTQKEQEILQLKDRFGRMTTAVFTDFRGMNVESMVRLRREFSNKQVEYRVVKNTLVKRAIAEASYADDVSRYLAESTAVAWSYEDPTAPARVIKEFQKGNEFLKIKCGVLDGKALSPQQVESLATMPSKKEMMGQLLALLIAAPQALMRQMIKGASDVASLLEAREKQLESQGKE